MTGRVFFLYSTGRCGTQWLTEFFEQNLGERAVVKHEPLSFDWCSRQVLRHPDLGAMRRQLPQVNAHLDRIAGIVDDGYDYIEVGPPPYAWFPYLAKCFGDRFRWAHVVRNPLYAAGSFASHGLYRHNSNRPFEITPDDRGVAYPEIGTEWQRLTRYEKCLYRWLEVNRYGADLAAETATEGRTVEVFRFEDLFSGDAGFLTRLFGQLGHGDPIRNTLAIPAIDNNRNSSGALPLIHSSKLWNEVSAIAERLGYSAEEVDHAAMRKAIWRRYSDTSRGSPNLIRKAVRRTKACLLMLNRRGR